MTLLNEADRLYLGDNEIGALYRGEVKLWPPPFTPDKLTGLAVWHDAADYSSGDWPNRAGSDPAFVGTPNPAISPVQKNGLPVVRFKANEGRLRGTMPGVNKDFTAIYATRLWGPNVGRALTATYPGTSMCNLVVGFHSSGWDWCYDNGNVNTATGWPGAGPQPWKLYTVDGTTTPSSTRFFINGVQSGVDWSTGHGWGGLYNLSGYDATGTQETMDCEVCELVIYNRRLSDTERVQVEDYLREKWGL